MLPSRPGAQQAKQAGSARTPTTPQPAHRWWQCQVHSPLKSLPHDGRWGKHARHGRCGPQLAYNLKLDGFPGDVQCPEPLMKAAGRCTSRRTHSSSTPARQPRVSPQPSARAKQYQYTAADAGEGGHTGAHAQVVVRKANQKGHVRSPPQWY